MSFMLPIELADPEVRPGIERAAAGAQANGTPFISFFTPSEMLHWPAMPALEWSSMYRRLCLPNVFRGQDGWPSSAK